MKTLGQVLKESRERASKTLREVGELTGISDAYLSQLENDKIKKPSANVLYKLSSAYEVELDVFLAAAGIIENAVKPKQSSLQKKLAFMADKLSEDEEKEVLNYIEYLRHKKKMND
jgi:transcriptional regulator with XRE-family HTH domain